MLHAAKYDLCAYAVPPQWPTAYKGLVYYLQRNHAIKAVRL